jgi:ribonuclease-3 family protein
VRSYSPLALAFIGDGVFELMVRSWLVLHGKATNRGLHKATVGFVAAPAQAKRVEKILGILTAEENEVYRRGRNTNTNSIPKAASREEYQAATALEALFGWLYLRGETVRLNELFDIMMEES